jgi:FdhD protein
VTAPADWLTQPDALVRLGTADPLVPHHVVRWDHGVRSEREDLVAEESPVTLVYNGVPHVVMMATPTNLIDFTLGFSITEGLIRTPADLLEVACVPHTRGMEMQATVSEECMAVIGGRTRRLSGRTGCGVCGSDSVDAVIRPVPPVPHGHAVSSTAIHRALDGLVAQQELNRSAGAVHAAGWATYDGDVLLVREDVGRHNALDKMIGAALTRGIDRQSGFVVVTSRASFEMVHKTAMLGASLLVTVSGATALAVRMAHQAGLTLCGFTRKQSHTVYTHAWRVIDG